MRMDSTTSLRERDHLEAGKAIRRALQVRVGGAKRDQDGIDDRIDLQAVRGHKRDGERIRRLREAVVMRARTLGGTNAAQ